MLVEKYRPETLKDVIGHEGIVSQFRGYVRKGEMPHLLLVGNSGVGKTAVAIALAKEMGCYPDAFIELNASDERGINVVRTKIKNFARAKAIVERNFKIILLDEADMLTKPAQQALRRTMEVYHKTCRFILTANSLSAVRDAIQSRCTKYFFRDLDLASLYEIISRVQRKEGIEFPTEVNKTIINVAEGDARKAINLIEGLMNLDSEPTPEDVMAMSGYVDEANVWQVMNNALNGNIEAIDQTNAMIQAGTSPTEMMRIMYFTAMKGTRMSDENRLRVIKAMGIIPGQNDKFRLTAVLAELLLEQ